MNKSKLNNDALSYHEYPRPGKIEVIATKPCKTQLDLSLAYTPGVAKPCLEIEKSPEKAYAYTSKGNLVAVITNGTAVLGLGDIGALAGKPVMEGKGVLFKRFADIDVFDIELASKNVDEIIKTCQMLEPTFGGINLEDIKAPECFIIEEALKKSMSIPVFHDDQHGTAIIGGAALLNATKVVGKKIGDIKVVINGAGASGLAIANLITKLGVKPDHLTVCDTKGVIYKGRAEGMNKYKEKFATDTKKRTLADAISGADVLFGLSAKGAFSEDMIKSMAKDPIIMAMANPDPEITPEEVVHIRKDALMATGRSDYPNQVNNVLCFPFLFRGALDVRATAINEEMKVAAAHAIANLARLPVPESVCRAYGVEKLEFGKEYILPKPFDHRVLTIVSIAVAKAAMESGVATKPIKDFDEYRASLETRLNPGKKLANRVIKKAKEIKARIGFSYANKPSMLSAAYNVAEDKIGTPVLIGSETEIKSSAAKLGLDIAKFEIIDPAKYKHTEKFAKNYYEKFWRAGVSEKKALSEITDCGTHFSAALLEHGDIDCLVAYAPHSMEETVMSLADITDLKEDFYTASLSSAMAARDHEFIIADPRLYTEPDSESLEEIILQTVETAKLFDIEPRVALISNSDFGKPESLESDDIRCALESLKVQHPKLIIDGDIRFDTATNPAKAAKYPLSALKGDANVLVFSNAQSADAVCCALESFGGFTLSANVLQGFEKPIQIASTSTDFEDIVTLAAVAAASVEHKSKKKSQ